MIYVRVVYWIVLLALMVWWLFDFIIPVIRGRPAFTMFKRNTKNQILDDIVEINQELDQAELESELAVKEQLLEKKYDAIYSQSHEKETK